MPQITIKMFTGRSKEQKAEITEVFSRELTRILNGDHGPITVKFDEIPREEDGSKVK